ncbi:MAG: sigma-54-dependent Fis family transcriptional regulator [Deltaproteobacteria bacterium]|nr:sigma-54-dependent Fis family transcriptional regulator [Deltaproteobacteria bacterium]
MVRALTALDAPFPAAPRGRLLVAQPPGGDDLHGLWGRTEAMRHLKGQIDHASRTDASVLLLGETGTGKELIAHAIHRSSLRADGPLEIIDCGALTPSLIASELFGHERGAFTGATEQHQGAFERASGGTIFLDEIGELPAELQVSLLGALERRSFRRVGGTKQVPVDVRVICSTHRDLHGEVEKGTFRQDLFFRVAVLVLYVPPLRQRSEDIPLLVEHFLRATGYQGSVDMLLPPQTIEALVQHGWPGNVRELRNFVEATVALGRAPALHGPRAPAPGAFPSVPLSQLLNMTYKEALDRLREEFQQLYLRALLERTQGCISEAARIADMNRTHLSSVRKRLGL